MATTDKLYTPAVLALATELARWPLDADLARHGSARSPTCGSTIDMAFDLAKNGTIARLGLRARACAIGQGAAALFAQDAIGQSQQAIAASLTALEHWLAGGPLPDWPGLDVIAAARDFPARHGAILLPWRAALVALDQPG